MCWALWAGAAFDWHGTRIELSLAALGVCQTLVQELLAGPAGRPRRRRGRLRGARLATRGWVVFAVMPVFAIGGIGVPALQSFATRQVGEDA